MIQKEVVYSKKTEKDDLIFQNFKNKYRDDFKEEMSNIVDYYHYDGKWRILIEFSDGICLLYDLLMDDVKTYLNLDDVFDIDHLRMDEKEWREGFAKNLRELLHRNVDGYNENISNKTGISNSMLSRYLKGESTPSSYTIMKLANALNCTVDDLIFFNKN